MNKKLLDIIACPTCKGPLTYRVRQKVLLCKAERLSFPIRDDVPILLPDEAQTLSTPELEAVLAGK